MKILPDNFSSLAFLKDILFDMLIFFKIFWPWILVAVLLGMVARLIFNKKK